MNRHRSNYRYVIVMTDFVPQSLRNYNSINLIKRNDLKNLKLSFSIVLLFLLSNIINAQVTVSNADEVVAQNLSSITLNFSVPTGEDRMLLISTGSDLSPLSLTFDGTPMVFQSFSGNAAIWTLALGDDLTNPTAGDIIFTITGGPAQYIAINALSCNGVDQTTPIENITNQTIAASATSSSITIASKTNDLVYDGVIVGCVLCFSAPTATTSLPATSLQNDLSFVGLGFAGTGKSGTTPGATSVSPGWTFGGSSVTNGVHTGLNIRSSIALPVELSTFSARQLKDHVVLEWETLSETNNSGFEIERSTDGNHFQKINFQPSHGTTNDTQRYQFTDVDAPKGLLYFRLKQLDYNGDFEYSPVVAIELAQQGFTLYPNPTRNEIQVETVGLESTRLEIFDARGQLLKHFDLTDNSSTLDLSDLSNGIFMAVVTTANQVYVQRLIKNQ